MTSVAKDRRMQRPLLQTSGSRLATEMEGADLRTKVVKERPGAAVWKTGSYCAAVLTHQLTEANSGCPGDLPGTVYGNVLAINLESVYSPLMSTRRLLMEVSQDVRTIWRRLQKANV